MKLWKKGTLVIGVCGISISTYLLSSCSISLPYLDGQSCTSTNSHKDDSTSTYYNVTIKPSTPRGSKYIWYYFKSQYTDENNIKWDKIRFGYDLSHFDNGNLFINPLMDFPSKSDFDIDPPQTDSQGNTQPGYDYSLLLFRFQITYNGSGSSHPSKPSNGYYSQIGITYHGKSWRWDRNYYQGPSISINWDSSWWPTT